MKLTFGSVCNGIEAAVYGMRGIVRRIIASLEKSRGYRS